MRILLALSACGHDREMNAVLTQNLIDVFRLNGHTAAVCAADTLSFHHAGRYACSEPAQKFTLLKDPNQPRTLEEELYQDGALSFSYLQQDYADLEKAIEEFQPQLILECKRPQAIAAASMHGIRCWSLVHSAMVRSRRFPADYIREFNQFLSSIQMSQVLSLRDLLQKAGRRIACGPDFLQPFPKDFPVDRIGSAFYESSEHTRSRRVCVYAGDLDISPRRLLRICREAFQGASYPVDLFLPQARPEKRGNITVANTWYAGALKNCGICIYDGNDLLYQKCLSLGIPQLIINDTSWNKSWNAASIVRNGIGVSLNLWDLDMISLYENYQTIRSDDAYQDHAEQAAAVIAGMGGLEGLLKYL